jgi:hypothetical protein
VLMLMLMISFFLLLLILDEGKGREGKAKSWRDSSKLLMNIEYELSDKLPLILICLLNNLSQECQQLSDWLGR